MGSWRSLVGAGMHAAIARRTNALGDTRRCAERAGRDQTAQLRWLLERARATAFGRAHAFARIAALEDDDLVAAYQEAAPLVDFPAYKGWLDRMRVGGEANVAWPGFVEDWAQTSGTTAGEKFIPVSTEMLAHNKKAALDIFATAARFGVSLPYIFGGKILVLGGSSRLNVEPNGTRWGDLSGISTRLMRWPLSACVIPDTQATLLGEWKVKLERLARTGIDADVRWMNGMPSWGLKLFERMIEMAREDGRDVSCVRDIWPNLQGFVHGGVRYTPFAQRLIDAWSGDAQQPIPNLIEVYTASEAFIGIQDVKGDPGLRLTTDHRVFYEFVPVEEVDNEDASAFACDRVEKGQRYAVALSTCAGLWRFKLGDIVEFDTIPPDGPPRLRIVGRLRHFINAFGEHIVVDNIESAVVRACEATGARVGEFSAAPVYPGGAQRAGLELVVEWDERNAGLGERFAEAFDEGVKGVNMDYATKRRNDTALAPPRLTRVPMGAFHRWMEREGKLGGQHKCPRCANDRDIVDAVVRLSHETEGVTA